MKASSHGSLLGAAALLWLVLITGLYYVVHKPFNFEQALSLSISVWRVLLALVCVSLAGGLGALVLHLPEEHPLEEAVLQASLGLGIFSLGGLILGVTIGVRPWLGWAVLLLLSISLRRRVLLWWKKWDYVGRIIQKSTRFGRLLAVGTCLIFALTLLSALAPPFKFDALVYHLSLPQIYIHEGRFVYTPEIMFWGMPQVGEMLYTWMMQLGGAPAASVMGWSIGLLACAGMVGYIGERMGADPAWVGTASALAGTTLASALSWAYVDWLVLLFGLAAIISLDLWRAQKWSRYLIWAGIFAGLALGTKYTAGVLLLSGGVFILWVGFSDRGDVGSKDFLVVWIRTGLIFGSTALVVSSPWWIKNYLATGNPFYPFFFPAGAMDRLRLDLYQAMPAWGGWQDVLLLPVRATLTGVEGAPGYAASVGPLLLGLGAWAWLNWPGRALGQQRAILNAAILVVVGLIVWALAGRSSGLLIQSRLYLAIFPAIALLAGAGHDSFCSLRLPGLRLGRIASVVVLMVFSFTVFELTVMTVNQNPLGIVLGTRTQGDYLRANLGQYALAMDAVRELPDGSKTLMLWEPRSFYCQPACVPDDILDRWKHDLSIYGSSQEVLSAWRQSGYSNLLVFNLGADFTRQEDHRYALVEWQTLETLLNTLPPPVKFGAAYSLYELK